MKGKDASPKATIDKIQKAFSDIGINMQLDVFEPVEGITSIRLNDPAHKWGVNGKGTGADWALASAWGEAAERFQNRFVYEIPKEARDGGFLLWPDEKVLPVDHIRDMDFLYEDLKRTCSEPDWEGRRQFVMEYAGGEGLSFSPFYSVKTKGHEYIPEQLLTLMCASNGFAAGNTYAEACVQALCEVIERYAKYEIYKKELTPPLIDREYIKKEYPGYFLMIEEIEEKSGCRVKIRDASLGMGLPVLNVLLIDEDSQCFATRFGCFPLFSIALERCLTELLQGWPDLSDKQNMVPWPSDIDIFSTRNMTDAFRTDKAALPDSFFAGKDSWQFENWDMKERANEEYVSLLCRKLLSIAPDVFIRKTGFMGIPSVRIYVPGVSIVPFRMGRANIRYNMLRRIIHEPMLLCDVTDEDEVEELIKVMTGDDSSVGNASDKMGMNPSYEMVLGLLSYSVGRDEDALRYLSDEKSKKARCMREYIRLGKKYQNEEMIKALLVSFFGEDTANTVCAALSERKSAIRGFIDPSGLFKALYESRAAESERLYKERLISLENRIRTLMLKSMPDQDGIEGVEL